MGFQSIDLGMCRGCLWEGDPRSVVIGLPGALTVGAPGLIFSLQAIVRQGWSAIQVIDEYHDRSVDPTSWVEERAGAAITRAAGADRILVVAKSLSTRAAGLVADGGYPAVWLTPLLDDPTRRVAAEVVELVHDLDRAPPLADDRLQAEDQTG